MRYPILPVSLLGALLVFCGAEALAARSRTTSEQIDGRELFVHVPARTAPPGKRALVIVLHGGVANAQSIVDAGADSGLNLDAVADDDGFIVAYLNGTQARHAAEPGILSWNAGGGCCGLPVRSGVDDVSYIRNATTKLVADLHVDPRRVFAIGHSNGAMMAQRMLCETSVFAAVVSISGPLNLPEATCDAARGKRVLAIHGEDDTNVPLAGRDGVAGGRPGFGSEARAQQIFLDAGASYELRIVPGADHGMDHMGPVLEREEGVSIAQKAASFFGLDRH